MIYTSPYIWTQKGTECVWTCFQNTLKSNIVKAGYTAEPMILGNVTVLGVTSSPKVVTVNGIRTQFTYSSFQEVCGEVHIDAQLSPAQTKVYLDKETSICRWSVLIKNVHGNKWTCVQMRVGFISREYMNHSIFLQRNLVTNQSCIHFTYKQGKA